LCCKGEEDVMKRINICILPLLEIAVALGGRAEDDMVEG